MEYPKWVKAPASLGGMTLVVQNKHEEDCVLDGTATVKTLKSSAGDIHEVVAPPTKPKRPAFSRRI